MSAPRIRRAAWLPFCVLVALSWSCAAVVSFDTYGARPEGPRDATLATLTLSHATLVPELDATTTEYRARALASFAIVPARIRVTAAPTQPEATITVDGAPLAAGQPSATIPISLGSTKVDVLVTAPDSTTTKHYSIDVAGYTNDYFKASNPLPDGGFGSALALSGNTLAIGAPGLSTSSVTSAVYVFTRPSTTWAWSQQAVLEAPLATRSFGLAIALDGNTLAVTDAARVTVFVRSGTSWTVQAQLTPPFAFLGASVALQGNTLVVGIPQLVAGDASGGTALVYERTGNNWSQTAHLDAPATASPSAGFGKAIAMDGDTIVVGAPNDQGLSSPPGTAYVFVKGAGSWDPQAELHGATSQVADRFGNSIALVGGTLVIGSAGDASASSGVNADPTTFSSTQSGAVHVFVGAAFDWKLQAYIKPSTVRPYQAFGTSVALSQDILAVGAPFDTGRAVGVNGDDRDTSSTVTGAAYVFERSDAGVWRQRSYVKGSRPRVLGFGHAVALSPDTLAVGAPMDSSNAMGIDNDDTAEGNANSGAVFGF